MSFLSFTCWGSISILNSYFTFLLFYFTLVKFSRGLRRPFPFGFLWQVKNKFFVCSGGTWKCLRKCWSVRAAPTRRLVQCSPVVAERLTEMTADTIRLLVRNIHAAWFRVAGVYHILDQLDCDLGSDRVVSCKKLHRRWHVVLQMRRVQFEALLLREIKCRCCCITIRGRQL